MGSLLFHSPCFDGIVSAVLTWDFLEHCTDWGTPRLHAVNYDVRQTWLQRPLERPAAVVDFLYHPAAQFWADHHLTTFLSNEVQRDFAQRKDSFLTYDPAARSCAGLLWRWLTEEHGYRNARYAELVDWADKIDSAGYDSVEEAISSSAPALRITLGFSLGQTAGYTETLVRELRDKSIADVAALSEPNTRFLRAQNLIEIGLDRFKRSAHIEPDGIVVFDVDTRDAIVSRYAPYHFFPDARYSAGIMRWEGGAKVTAMRNPWREFASVPLGRIAESLGGGGHQRVGSIALAGDRVATARSVLDTLIAEIRKSTEQSPAD